jgi:hypothetical protein
MSTVSEGVKTRNGATPERAGVAKFKSAKGTARDYPREGRCDLCSSLPKERSLSSWDRKLVQPNGKVEYRRDYLCYHCKHLVGVIEAIGLKKLITYWGIAVAGLGE